MTDGEKRVLAERHGITWWTLAPFTVRGIVVVSVLDTLLDIARWLRP